MSHPEVPDGIEQVWVRIDRLAQKLGTHGKSQEAADDIRTLVEELRQNMKEAQKALQSVRRSQEGESPLRQELASYEQEISVLKREIERTRSQLSAREAALKQEREGNESLIQKLEERDREIHTLQEKRLHVESELKAGYAKKREALFTKVAKMQKESAQALEKRLADSNREREKALEFMLQRDSALLEQKQEQENRFHERITELEAKYAKAMQQLFDQGLGPKKGSKEPVASPAGSAGKALGELKGGRPSPSEKGELGLQAPQTDVEHPPTTEARGWTNLLVWMGATRTRGWVAAVLLVGLIAGGWLWTRRSPAPVSLPLSIDHTAGLVALEGNLLSVDWLNQKILSMDPRSGKVLHTKAFPNPFITGLALGQGALWSLAGDSKKILRHRFPDYAVEQRWSAPGAKPVALASDLESLWVADAEKRFVYRLKLPDLKEMFKAPLPAVPVDLLRQGEELWILDAQAELHIRRALDLAPVRWVPLKDLLPEGAKPTGMVLFDSRLWIVTENPPRLISFPPP